MRTTSITKATSDTKDLGHFIVNFNNCGVDSTNFVKFDKVPVGQNPLLKNESVWLTDFRVYEKNSNPNPGVPHE